MASIYGYAAIVKTVTNEDDAPTYNEDYGVYDPTNASGEELVELRTAPFGPPEDRDNEPYNPGRHQYSSEKGSSYSTREPRKFFFLNEMTQYNTKDNWQSGPCDNDPARDHVSEHAGYWTSPCGESCDWSNFDGPGDPHKPTTFSMTIVSSKKKNLIYNIGHGDWLSTSEGVDYGVVGISGHIGATFDLNYRDRGQPDGYASVGIQHIYCMYRADIEEDEIPPLIEEMEEMVKWFGEIDEIMSEVFPNGIPDDLEEQLEAAMNNNSAVNVDQNSEVGGYSTRAVNALLTGEKLEKLKGIRFEKNDTTIKILEILKELMGRSFSGKGRVDRLEYNADVTSDYIMTLFKTPASYDFDEEIIDVYSEGTELITGVELLMWYLHEFFDDNENIDSLLSIIQSGSTSTSSNRVARDFFSERVGSYWTLDPEEQPKWNQYGIVTYYDGFDFGLKYHIHNANEYRIALWWTYPNEEFSNGAARYGGFIDPGLTIEVPALGTFLKIAAVSPDVPEHDWGRMFGRKTKVNINESVASYGTGGHGVPDSGTPGSEGLTFKIYNGLGYYQSKAGQKPKWGAVKKGSNNKELYHNTWLDPDVTNGDFGVNTNKGHNTPCTWALPCRTVYTDLAGFVRDESSKYVIYLPKYSDYKRYALWVCKANLNINNEITGQNAQYQWEQLKVLERGKVYKFKVIQNDDPKGIINGQPHTFYRIGILPDRDNGPHHFEDPTVRQTESLSGLPVVPRKGIFTAISFWPTRNYEDMDADFSIQKYITTCHSYEGTVELIPDGFVILEDGRKHATFQCTMPHAGELLMEPLMLTDDYDLVNLPAAPRKPIIEEEILVHLPAVNYNDDPGTWRLNGGTTEPRSGEKFFYYIKDRGYIIYWSLELRRWVEKPPSQYRYETLSANKSVPGVLASDKEGDLCVMRNPWGKVISGEGGSTNEQFDTLSNSAGFVYIFLDGKWHSVGNMVAYKNTSVIPSAAHEFEFILIHDNSNININYDDPDNPGNNLHINNIDPNYMLYVKGDGRSNNAYSDKNFNFVGFIDPEDPEKFDKRNVYMQPTGLPPTEQPLEGRELVWVEPVYRAPLGNDPGSRGDKDYGDFVRGGEMYSWDEIDRKWLRWPSMDMKTYDGKLSVSNSNPTSRPTQLGQYHVNKSKKRLYVSWRTAKKESLNDGYEYSWNQIDKDLSMINNEDYILVQRPADEDFLRIGYRKLGGFFDQIFCGNTNQDSEKFMHLIAGPDGSPDATVNEWRYFKSQADWTAKREEGVDTDDVYYDFIELNGSASRVYRTTYNSELEKVDSVDITFFDTSYATTYKNVILKAGHEPGNKYKNPANPNNYPIPEGAFAVEVGTFSPSQIMQARDSGSDAPTYAGIVNFSNDTGVSHQIFANVNTIVETDHKNINGNGQSGVPSGTYPGLDNNPFLIFKNPDNRGGGPLWKYFSQTINGIPVGWKVIVGGRVSDGQTDDYIRVNIGNANGDYDTGGGTGVDGGAGTGGVPSGDDRPNIGYRTRSTGSSNGTPPSGQSSGSDYYDPTQREYVKRRSTGIIRARRLPSANDPTLNVGDVVIISNEDYDFTNKRPADGTPGRNSTVVNYDSNEMHTLGLDENRDRVWRRMGVVYDSADRTGVNNNPPNLSTGQGFINDNQLEVVSNSVGSSTYTTLTGEEVEQTSQDVATEESHPSQPILGRGTPTEPPGPLPEGVPETNSPPIYSNTAAQYTQTEIINPPGPNTASEIKVTDKSSQTARENSFIWRGESTEEPRPSRTDGIWIDLRGANLTFGPILPKNEATSKNDGDIHLKTATSTSKTAEMFIRQGGEMVRGPGGSENSETIPIVRDGDVDRNRPASAPANLRVRIQEPDPNDENDDTQRRVVLDVATQVSGVDADDDGFVDAVDRWGIMIAGEPFDAEDEIIEVPSEYELPNTRYYYGLGTETRPDWAIYEELWTWELDKTAYVFFYRDTTKAEYPTLSRHPSDQVSIWTSEKNSADPRDWTKVGSMSPGEKLTHKKYGLNPSKAYYRVAVKHQKSPNDTVLEKDWNSKGYKIPVAVCLDLPDPEVQTFIQTEFFDNILEVDAYVDENTGQVIKKETNNSTGEVTLDTMGGWEKQIVKKGPGSPPKENEGEVEIDEDGNPLNNYGPEVTNKPQGMSEVNVLPKLKNKIGDSLYLKDKNTGRGKVYVYDGKEGNDGWALVGTKRCPNTKNPGPGDYPGHPHWYPSRNKPYVWNGEEYVNPLQYHPKDENGNDIIPDEPDDSGDKEIDLEPGDAIGILGALAEVSAYAAIFAASILAAKAVAAIWLKKMETDFLAECTEFEAGHELPIGLGSSDVNTFCKWYDLNYKFINMTISPEMRLITQLLRCRFNGYMFHLAHVGPGKQDIRQLKVHSIVPTYSWGLIEMKNHRVLRVLREYSRESTRSSTDTHQWGVQVDRSIKLDTRKRIVNQQGVTIDVPAVDDEGNNIYNEETGQLEMVTRPWMHTDAWFKPQTSVCLRTTGQDYVYTKARERYQIGDVGLEWIKAEGNSSGHPEVSGMNKHRTGPGLYVMNIFNDIGAGSKYYEHYNTDNSSHAWVWEVLAHEPKPWPIGFTTDFDDEKQVGIEFDLGSINVNKDQPRAARDWQINFIHLSFETKDGRMKSIKVMPTGGYAFRNSEAFGKPSTHVMGQLENDQYRRVTCWSSDTIESTDKFWGFAVNAWIGTEYAADRWRCYNMKNLKPLVRDPQ